MAEGRRRDEWDRWSVLLAVAYNSGRTTGRRKPADFNPFVKPAESDVMTRAEFRAARGVK
jgi:hypothetical protein